jgi:hypothetical protein
MGQHVTPLEILKPSFALPESHEKRESRREKHGLNRHCRRCDDFYTYSSFRRGRKERRERRVGCRLKPVEGEKGQ